MTRISKEKIKQKQTKKKSNKTKTSVKHNRSCFKCSLRIYMELLVFVLDSIYLKAGFRELKLRRQLFRMWLLCQDVDPIVFDAFSHSIYSTSYLFLQPINIHRIFHPFRVIDLMVDRLDFVQSVNHQIQNHFLVVIMRLDWNLVVETNVLL